jgi:hypothetical protein
MRSVVVTEMAIRGKIRVAWQVISSATRARPGRARRSQAHLPDVRGQRVGEAWTLRPVVDIE